MNNPQKMRGRPKKYLEPTKPRGVSVTENLADWLKQKRNRDALEIYIRNNKGEMEEIFSSLPEDSPLRESKKRRGRPQIYEEPQKTSSFTMTDPLYQWIIKHRPSLERAIRYKNEELNTLLALYRGKSPTIAANQPESENYEEEESWELSILEGYQPTEGQLKEYLHYRRERNPKIVLQKKISFRKDNGTLYCEACNFNFETQYGNHGKDFIECHHIKPLHARDAEGEKTKLDDLILLCSNCHRMIHRNKKWLTLEELKNLLVSITYHHSFP